MGHITDEASNDCGGKDPGLVSSWKGNGYGFNRDPIYNGNKTEKNSLVILKGL